MTLEQIKAAEGLSKDARCLLALNESIKTLYEHQVWLHNKAMLHMALGFFAIAMILVFQ